MSSTSSVSHALLEGEISVSAALTARNRAVHRIVIASDKPPADTREVARMAREAQVKVERLPRLQVDALAQGQSHGGVIAEVGERRFAALADLLPHPAALSPNAPLIVMLDGVEDPFNFGQAVRALYAAGVDGLVVRSRNWMSAAGRVARASAGASELMPTALADDPQTAAAFYKSRGLRVAVTARDRRAASIYNADLTQPTFLVIGGEKRGVNREFMDGADVLLKIPYRRKFPQSLGSAASAAVIAFEVMRQRFRT